MIVILAFSLAQSRAFKSNQQRRYLGEGQIAVSVVWNSDLLNIIPDSCLLCIISNGTSS